MESVPGSRLMPVEIDRLAQNNPTKVVESYPTSNSLTENCYRDVTMLDLSRAINRTCSVLEPIIGDSPKFSTFAFYGPPDMRYHLFIIAMAKLHHKALIPAPRNSPAMHLELLKLTDCGTIFHTKEMDIHKMLSDETIKDRQLHTLPDLEYLLWDEAEPKHYPFTKTYDEAKYDPFVILREYSCRTNTSFERAVTRQVPGTSRLL